MRIKTTRLSFDTLHLEGGLFVPDLLEKTALGTAPGQTVADYKLPRGLRLSDEYGRAFQIALAAWKAFETRGKSEEFVLEVFRDCLGFTSISKPESLSVSDLRFPVEYLLTPSVPMVIAPKDWGLDDSQARWAVEGAGSRKKSAFQLTQEFLNASGDHTWAVVTNGTTVRLLRDSQTLVRPNWLEFDLGTILRNERYADFKAFWMILHSSRAPLNAPGEGIWGQWRTQGIEEGTRVRTGLRDGVTKALISLGKGFLTTKGTVNDILRQKLLTGGITPMDYYQQVLRLVYRFLFLFTIEERGFLHPTDPNDPVAQLAQALYAQGYSMARLRDQSLKKAGYDRYSDLWQGVRVVFAALNRGEPRMDLPALGGVFLPEHCADLESCQLSNRSLLEAMHHLRWSTMGGNLALIDYRNMGPEELGSVYESLLELVPVVDLSAQSFGFVGIGADDGSTAGNARKTTGSYYTPDSLVQELIRTTLDPVIEARLADTSKTPEASILSMTVIDPSCGSGHFLLSAARRMAERLAQVRSADGAVTSADYRHAVREVVGRCLYGVDRNPMAIELARMALWLEGFEPGKPLSFLDHHLQVGDSLLGIMDLNSLWKGIPDAAYKALSGDDKKVVKALADENRGGKKRLTSRAGSYKIDMLLEKSDLTKFREIESMGEDSLADVEAKRRAWFTSMERLNDHRLSTAADMVIGAFLSPKLDVEALKTTPTSAHLQSFLTTGDLGFGLVEPRVAHVKAMCRDALVFHWPLRFAAVFEKGGFDVVLGNPPWERIKLQEEEFFASRHQEIATASNKAARQKLIEQLEAGSPYDKSLLREFMVARRTAEAASMFAHVKDDEGGRFPLTGVGDVNTYALFAETILQLTHKSGRAGFIVPSGIASDDSTKAYFDRIASKGHLVRLSSFENEEFIFPSVHHAFRFCLVVLGGEDPGRVAQFVFFARKVADLADPRRQFNLSPQDLGLLNPNTRTCPIFRSNKDAEITKKIFERVPVLIREATIDGDGKSILPEQNPWGISFQAMFHMSGDSDLFLSEPGPESLPLYEAKLVHQFDHRWATFRTTGRAFYKNSEGNLVDDEVAETIDVTDIEKMDPAFSVRPRYWVDRRQVLARIASIPRNIASFWLTKDEPNLRLALSHPETASELRSLAKSPNLWDEMDKLVDQRSPRWLIGWRDITLATNERTVIASLLPRFATGDTLLLMFPSGVRSPYIACLTAEQDSLVHDFVARQKVGGTHLKYHVKKQLPNLSPQAYSDGDLSYLLPRVLELTYTTHDMAPWAEDVWKDLDGNGRLELLRQVDESRYWWALASSPGCVIDRAAFTPPSVDELATTAWSESLLPPFAWNPERRAVLRAELDARFARLYGLTRDDLRYVLDPTDVMGDDYPSRTFFALTRREVQEFGEYRTQRLVLEAWDREEANG